MTPDLALLWLWNVVLHSSAESGKSNASQTAPNSDDEGDVVEPEETAEIALNGPVGATLVRECLPEQELNAIARLECEVRGPEACQTPPVESDMRTYMPPNSY